MRGQAKKQEQAQSHHAAVLHFTGDAEANDPDIQRGGYCLFILSG